MAGSSVPLREGREADLCRPLDGRIECTACARRCRLREGQVGLCGVRAVQDDRLRLLVYGRVAAAHIDPIEKKPVLHYRPGARVFSIGTTGCNWMCRYCQNHDLSQRRRVEGVRMEPGEVVAAALRADCRGLAYTYNQPSIFMEFARDTGLLGRREGLFNVFVSNGYDTPEGVREMDRFLDCITVDFKGNAERDFTRRYISVPDPEPVFDTLHRLRAETGIHVEVTDLVVPEVGDDLDAARRLCKRLFDEFGPLLSVHFLRFHPDYRMRDLPPTPVATLERHAEVAREAGFHYVYIGNVWGHPLEDTYCHGCGRRVVDRHGFQVVDWDLETRGDGNHCPDCGTKVPIVGAWAAPRVP